MRPTAFKNATPPNSRVEAHPLSVYRRGLCASAIIAFVCLTISITLGGCTAATRGDAERMSRVAAQIETFALQREATDHEALYTLAGGLKPMSTRIWRGSFKRLTIPS